MINFPSQQLADAVVAWSPDLHYAALQQEKTQTVHIWEVKTQQVISSFNYADLSIVSQIAGPNSWSLCWSADNHWLALPDQRQTGLDIYDLSTGQHASSISFSTMIGDCAAWSSNSKWIVAGLDTYEVWDVPAKRKLATFTPSDLAVGTNVEALAWSPDNQQIAFLFQANHKPSSDSGMC